MPEDERTPDAPGPDSGSVRVPPWLQDDVSILSKDYGLTEEESRRLIEAALVEMTPSVTPPEAIEAALASDGPLTFKLNRRDLADHVRTRREFDYDLMTLTAIQAALRDVLPEECVVHLAITGSKSSGKTKTTRIMGKLAGGRFFTGGTQAALVSQFGSGELVAIDEADALFRKLPDLEPILRASNSWNAPYTVSVPRGRGWDVETRNVGGPKVFNFRGEMDDATLSRAYILDLPRQTDSQLVVNNFDLDNPILDVRDRLRRLATKKALGWTRASALAHLKEPSFVARLDRLPATLGRHKETAAVFLLIGDILGLDLEDEMRAATERQAEADTESDDLREWLRLFYAAQPGSASNPDLEAPRSAVLTFVNEKRRLQGFRAWPEKSSEFKTKLRELGFEDGKNVFRRRTGRVLIFDAEVRKRLGLDGSPEARGLDSPVSAVAVPPVPTPPGPGLEQAVRELGPTVQYPDGTVTDRRTGAVLRGPA